MSDRDFSLISPDLQPEEFPGFGAFIEPPEFLDPFGSFAADERLLPRQTSTVFNPTEAKRVDPAIFGNIITATGDILEARQQRKAVETRAEADIEVARIRAQIAAMSLGAADDVLPFSLGGLPQGFDANLGSISRAQGIAPAGTTRESGTAFLGDLGRNQLLALGIIAVVAFLLLTKGRGRK